MEKSRVDLNKRALCQPFRLWVTPNLHRNTVHAHHQFSRDIARQRDKTSLQNKRRLELAEGEREDTEVGSPGHYPQA